MFSKNHHNLSLIAWLIVPMIFMVLTTRYLLVPKNVSGSDSPKNKEIINQKYKNFLVEQSEVPKFNWNGKAVVTFWFDDGWLSQYENAAPILEKNGFVGAVSVVTSHSDFGGFISWEKLRRLENKGWEITSHSKFHNCSGEKIEEELRDSKERLVLEGLSHGIFVPPCGTVSEEIKFFTRKYYLGMRLVGSETNPLPVKDKYDLQAFTVTSKTTLKEIEQWLTRAKKEKSWVILLFHQVEEENDEYASTPDFFEKTVALVKKYNMPAILPTQGLEIK